MRPQATSHKTSALAKKGHHGFLYLFSFGEVTAAVCPDECHIDSTASAPCSHMEIIGNFDPWDLEFHPNSSLMIRRYFLTKNLLPADDLFAKWHQGNFYE